MLIREATLADGRRRDLRIADGRIRAVAEALESEDEETVRHAGGNHLLPGMIDSHVHFRQPGFGHKETWETGTKSAAAGGVTTVVDQPNTSPPTVDGETYGEKLTYTAPAVVDFGINGGVTPDWDPATVFDRPLFALGEVFLADSTGDMGIEAQLYVDALERAQARDVTVTVHAEDATLFNESARQRTDADAWSAYRQAQAEIQAIERACTLADRRETRIHIAHVSTPRGIDIADELGMTTEVTPHHLFLSREDLAALGTHGRMNPPLRREKRRQGVFERVAEGPVDMIATDHAPHTSEEKATGIWEAPSGVPGVETALPLLLAAVARDELSLERVRDLTARNPARIFDLPSKGVVEPGADADLVLVDLESTAEIRPGALHTKCDWTPFEGWEAVFPEWTMLRGEIVYERESDSFTTGRGQNVRTA